MQILMMFYQKIDQKNHNPQLHHQHQHPPKKQSTKTYPRTYRFTNSATTKRAFYLPAHMIAAIDQTGERTNFENKLNKNVINLNVALQSESHQLLSDIKKKKNISTTQTQIPMEMTPKKTLYLELPTHTT